MMRRLLPASALLASLLLAGCAGKHVQLDDRHVTARRVSADTLAPDCRLTDFVLRDGRPHSQLGLLNGHPLTYPELLAWIEQSIRTSVIIQTSGSALTIELARAYIESHPAGHSFQVVLRVRAEDEQAWRVYRGIESGITWWGTDREFGDYVERAGRAAIRDLIQSEGRCPAD